MEERVKQGQKQGQQFMDQSKHEVLDDQCKEMNQEFNSRSNNIGLAEVITGVVDTAAQTLARPMVKSLEWAGMMDMSGSSEPRIDYTHQLKEMSDSPSLKNVSHIKDSDDTPSVEGKETSYIPQSEMSKGVPHQDPISSVESVKDTSYESVLDAKWNEIEREPSHPIHEFQGMQHVHDEYPVAHQKSENVIPYTPKERMESDLSHPIGQPSLKDTSLSSPFNQEMGQRMTDDSHQIEHNHQSSEGSQEGLRIPYAPQENRGEVKDLLFRESPEDLVKDISNPLQKGANNETKSVIFSFGFVGIVSGQHRKCLGRRYCYGDERVS